MTTRITELQEPQRGWRYHSGTTVYTERFRDGRLIAASLQDTGIPCHARDEDPSTPAFDLQVDGESLAFGWDVAGSTLTGEGTDAPGTCLRLRHGLKPVDLEIVTQAGGDGFLRRRMRLTNTSKTATLGLTAVTPWPACCGRCRTPCARTCTTRAASLTASAGCRTSSGGTKATSSGRTCR